MLLPSVREIDLNAIAGGVLEGDFDVAMPARDPRTAHEDAPMLSVEAAESGHAASPAPDGAAIVVMTEPVSAAPMSETLLLDMIFRATLKNMSPKRKPFALPRHEAQRQAAEWGIRKILERTPEGDDRNRLVALAQTIADSADQFLPCVVLFRDAVRKNITRGMQEFEAFGPASAWALRELDRDRKVSARDRAKSSALIMAERPRLTTEKVVDMLEKADQPRKTAGAIIDFIRSDGRLAPWEISYLREAIIGNLGARDAKRIRERPGFTVDEVTEAYTAATRWVDERLEPPKPQLRRPPQGSGGPRVFRSFNANVASASPREHRPKETAPAAPLSPEEETRRAAENKAERQRRAEASAAASRSLTKAMMETPGEARRRVMERARQKAAKAKAEGGKKKGKKRG
jgi:hypothetical protein